MKITVPQIMRAIPTANRQNVTEFVDCFNQWGDKFGIKTVQSVTHFIAQLATECAEFKAFEENLNYSAEGLLRTWPTRFTKATAAQYARQPQKIANKVYANRMGNGSEASGDGWKYRGRGALQLTGKQNYRDYQSSGFCVGDLLSHPEWLAKSPGAYKSAMWFWWKNNLSAIADLDDGGKMGEDLVTRITKKVNGGTNGLSTRKLYYRKLKKEFAL
jgi:putative chitinase